MLGLKLHEWKRIYKGERKGELANGLIKGVERRINFYICVKLR